MADSAVAGGWWRRLGSLSGRTAVALILLALMVAAADRSKLSLDVSADRRFTLSPRLTALVTAQQQPIDIVAVWGRDVSELAPIEAVLQRVGGLSPLVTFRRIDPELEKPLLTALQESVPDARPGMIYVRRGNRAMAIPVAPGLRVVLQRELGGALATLAEQEQIPLYLVRGHGELRPDGGMGDADRLLRRTFDLAGFDVRPWDATTAGSPSPVGVVVLAGPTAPVGERTVAMLDTHLRDGGGILLLADDRAGDDLSRWLRRHGLGLGAQPPADGANPRRVVVSLRHHFVGQEAAFPHHNLAIDGQSINPQHPVTAGIAREGVSLLSPWTSAVLPVQDAKHLVPLLATADGDVWEKTRAAPFEAPTDLARQPALPLAWAGEFPPQAGSVRAGVGGRLVVWGSRQAACDGVLVQGTVANDRLLRSAAVWLSQRTPPSDIPEAEIAAFQVRCSDGAMSLIMGLLLAVVPCAFLGGAMLTWWDRR